MLVEAINARVGEIGLEERGMKTTGYQIRETLLQICAEMEKQGIFQMGVVLREAASRLQCRGLEAERAVLTAWGDLFRTGVLAWGCDLANPNPPFVHFTETGRKTLSNLSRDPYNPAGYLAVIEPLLDAGSVALSYLREGVHTFQAGCLKATAVMVGAAAESLVLDVRDALVERLEAIGSSVPSKLKDWKVKTVRDGVEVEIDSRKAQLDKKLAERFASFWVPISDQMRLARNDAGHPVSVDPVTHETVHAALLLFPEFAKLVKDVTAWIRESLA